MLDVSGWTAAFLAGAVWGVVLFSWGLPLPLPLRFGATVLLVTVLAASSHRGMLAAGAFALGIGVSSSLLLASSGLLFAEWWALLPAAGLVAGVALHARALLHEAG
ncbi:MAG: hypothetical protein ACRDFY_03680 [Candidatus Limnocylindria bacterium]